MDVSTSAGEGEAAPHWLDDELADVMAELLQGTVTPGEAVAGIERACTNRARAVREESSQHMHRPARMMHLRALATEMEAQAATWHLLWCLYCMEQPPAGDGGPPLLAMGELRTYRQQVSEAVVRDPQLSRCARVVAWLESLADDVLTQQAAPRFAGGDGVWAETRIRSGQGGIVTELDPDAPTRQGKALHPDNVRADERLLQRVWQLLRAGHLKEARLLCRQCGQPWRAASLGACGDFGPLPVGQAATAMEEEGDAEVAVQAEDVVCEVDTGAGTLRALWKWTCSQAAQDVTAAVSGSKFEAAIYGALAGHVASVLPVCATWHDACWAYCRAWLDVHTDQLCSTKRTPAADLIGGDVVLAALQRVGVASASAQSTFQAGLSVVSQGAWPTVSLLHSGDLHQQLPHSFPAVFQALAASSQPAISAASRQHVPQVQQLIIEEATAGLMAHLHAWVVLPRSSSDGRAGATAAVGDVSATAAAQADGGLATASESGDWSTQTSEERATAFVAHLVLLLEALGVVRRATQEMQAVDHGAWVQQYNVQHQAEQVCGQYVVTLLERRRWRLVPQYLSHLPEERRVALCAELLLQLGRRVEDAMAAGDDDAAMQADCDCNEAHASLSRWLELSCSRQQEGGQAAGYYNELHTTVRPDEMRQLVLGFVERCRSGPEFSPLRRAAALRWLFYAFRVDFASSSPGLSHYADALSCACALSTELALGDAVTTQAAHLLFDHIIPPDFEEMATAMAEATRAEVAAAAAAGEAPTPGDGVAAEEPLAQASELDVLSAELSGWRTFFQLRRGLADWQDAYVAAASGSGQVDKLELMQGGSELLTAMTHKLLISGAWPPSSPPSLDLMAHAALSAAHTNSVTVELVLTGSSPTAFAPTLGDGPNSVGFAAVASAVAGGTSAGPWDSPACTFPVLRGPELFATESALRAALAANERAGGTGGSSGGGGPSAASSAGATWSLSTTQQTEGYLVVTLSCRPDQRAWRSLVALTCGVVSGSLAGAPPLLLVNLRADRTTSLAVALCCCLSQVLLDCFSLRRALVDLGMDAASVEAGADLVELLADGAQASKALKALSGGSGSSGGDGGGGCGELLDVLPPAALRRALVLEAETTLLAMRQAQRVGAF